MTTTPKLKTQADLISELHRTVKQLYWYIAGMGFVIGVLLNEVLK